MIYEIKNHNPKFGIRVANPKEKLMMMMYDAYKQGISPQQFRRSRISDIIDIMEIKNAVEEKTLREQEIQKLMAKVQ